MVQGNLKISEGPPRFSSCGTPGIATPTLLNLYSVYCGREIRIDATSVSRDTGMTEPILEEITARIERIDPNRESRNGNPYTLVVTDTADWIYCWNHAWRRELQQHYGLYYELDAYLYVRDKGGPESDDPRYDLTAILPQSRQLLKRFLERWNRQSHSELSDAVEKCRRRSDSPQRA